MCFDDKTSNNMRLVEQLTTARNKQDNDVCKKNNVIYDNRRTVS